MPAVSGDYDPDIGVLLQVDVRVGGTIPAAAGDNDAGSVPPGAGRRGAQACRYKRGARAVAAAQVRCVVRRTPGESVGAQSLVCAERRERFTLPLNDR